MCTTTADYMTIATGVLSNGGLAYLKEKVKKMNRRAARLKLLPITITVDSTEYVKREHPSGITIKEPQHTITIKGEVPKINGWQVIARIEFTPAGNLVWGAPEAGELNPRYRTMSNQCDHCRKERRRNDLVVIRHEDKREIVVGRNCLADYIRTGDVQGMLEVANWMGDLQSSVKTADNDYYGGGHRGPSTELLQTVLEASSICIRKLGWRSSQFDNPTKRDVINFLYGGRHSREAAKEHAAWIKKYNLYITDIDKQEAELAKQWLQTIPTDPASDYLSNLRVLRDLETIPLDSLGLACSVVIAAQRAREQEIAQKQYASKGPREFIGEEGERLQNIPVTVLRIHSTSGMYGVVTIIVFEVAGKGTLTWFASGDIEDYDVGEQYTITGTIKRLQDDARYGKTTIVNRVKMNSHIQPITTS